MENKTEKIREITDYYQNQMHEHHRRHAQRIAQIQHEHFIKGVILAVASALALGSPFIAMLFR